MPNIELHRLGIKPRPPLIECGRSTIELQNLYKIWVCLRPSTSLQMPNFELHRPGIKPGPPDRMRMFYHWAMESVHNMGVLTSQYFSPNAKYWTASSGNRTRAPPDRMWTLYYWAMESIHNLGVLVSWPRGRGQIFCNYSTPPPTSKHPCIPTLWRGRGSPASQPPPPEYLLTQHSYKETSAPL